MNTEFSLDKAKQDRVLDAFTDLIKEAYDNSEEHGFHKQYDDLMESVPVEQKQAMRRASILAKLALIASEVGEAVGAVQHGNDSELAMELADIVIRTMDVCGSEYIDLGRVMLAKMQHNRNRPYLHGKKC